MISNSRGAYRVHRWGVGTGLVGGAAVAAAMLCASSAHADDGPYEINGWALTPTDGGILSPVILTEATLSDPSNSLGLGTAPIAGEWTSGPAGPLSGVGSSDSFITLDQLGTSSNLFIENNWWPGVDEASVHTGIGNSVLAFLAPTVGGNELVDLFSFTHGDGAPLFNPDAAGPIDIGGLPLASPQDGALFNDLFDAIFTGNTADWANAMTLFDDWFGIDPAAFDAASWLNLVF